MEQPAETASDERDDLRRCPRCGAESEQVYWGPCPDCRRDLRATMGTDARDIQVAAYEPKMNVTPNAVATKD
ncbi:MAG: hypothetical protein JST73_08305 [Actinobacteria bacterium]|nr:hypothetical protein [Actinomycetota bacterium]